MIMVVVVVLNYSGSEGRLRGVAGAGGCTCVSLESHLSFFLLEKTLRPRTAVVKHLGLL